MKINDLVKSSVASKEIANKDGRRIIEPKSSGFSDRFFQLERKSAEERLHIMAEKIAEQGQVLAKKVDLRELKRYKAMISEFLKEAIDNTTEYSKNTHLGKRGRRSTFTTIKKINDELDELTKDVLSEQKDVLKIVGRLDDIKGLIVDILV